MDALQRTLSFMRRAVDDYQMIKDGDHIAVGISGGKDSLATLLGLAHLRRFYPHKFNVTAVTIDMGFPGGTDFSPIADFCESLNVSYVVVPTQIYSVVFEARKEDSPCSLCSKMRRGALHNAAKDLGCTSVALGHHFDDTVDTFMLNLFYAGRIGCFQPVTYLSRADLYVIRPLIYMPEKDVVYLSNQVHLPVIQSACPANGNTERAEMHALLQQLEKENKGLRYRIFGAMQRAGIDGFKQTERLKGVEAYSEEE